MNEHYDVIVVGSGAGGGTVTHALAPTGAKVLLLERGGWLPREVENWSPAAVWAEGRYHNSGSWTDCTNSDSPNEFEPKQNYYVGGNTKFYGAILFRFRERDFEAIQHVDGVSPAWPISYADLEPWYTKAERLYRVHGERGVDPDEPPASEDYPYPAISHEPRIAQLHSDLAAAGLHPFPLPNGILIDEDAPQLSACVRCATCDGFPCLVNGKADSQVICVEPALRYPNVTLLTGALVTRLETDPSGRNVNRVVVERDGAVETYSADVGRRDQLCCIAAGLRERRAPQWARQFVGCRRAAPDAAQQLVAHRVLQAAQPDEVPENPGNQRLLLRRR